ncbi:MAG TPA: deoxyribonuclease IV [Candidatus Limnocylindrales bacterium]|nr:deoxyribonuclease IV [Candidatus Limnocylindrales bacterium]
MSIRGPRLGVHLAHARGLLAAADRAAEIGADTIQVFVDNPTAWRRRAEPPKALPAFRERLASAGIAPIAVHAAYLVNLAGSDGRFHRQSIAVLAEELRAGAGYGARFVNAHVGSHLGSGPDRAVAQVVDAVSAALDATADLDARPMLVLENSAGGGNAFGTTIEELSEIFDAIRRRGIPDAAVGLCLDTAHLWGAGYALDDASAVDALFVSVEASIGIHRLVMLHLNDSKSERGSRSDRHEHIGAGRIGPLGLGNVLRHPAVGHVAAYLETPGMAEGYDAINLARARALLAGRALEPLPPEAFSLRRSRAAASSVAS